MVGKGRAGSRGWLRDAYVSARTVLSSEASRHAGQYMGTYPQLASQLQRWSGNAAADRFELYRRMIFNCCVSNTDDHERNHGLLADDAGHLRLSPAFDIVPRLSGTRRREQAMGIGAEGALATVDNLLSCAADFHIGEREALAVIDDVQQGVALYWRDCLKDRGMTAEEVVLLAPCFEELPRNEGAIKADIQARQDVRARQRAAAVPVARTPRS